MSWQTSILVAWAIFTYISYILFKDQAWLSSPDLLGFVCAVTGYTASLLYNLIYYYIKEEYYE